MSCHCPCSSSASSLMSGPATFCCWSCCSCILSVLQYVPYACPADQLMNPSQHLRADTLVHDIQRLGWLAQLRNTPMQIGSCCCTAASGGFTTSAVLSESWESCNKAAEQSPGASNQCLPCKLVGVAARHNSVHRLRKAGCYHGLYGCGC